ncbi:MAG TPA: hypothetical protein DDW90_07930 [Cyanobacteria bacterium UBA9971]|nr:hypothetical protein [Cyanobacteria bacterium UBA9971]
MPRRDGTGPMGMGQMTGKRMGVCAGIRTGQGCGNGRGMGNGRGFNAQFRANNLAPLQQDEVSLLKNQAAILESTLSNVKEKISKLEEKE